MRVLRSVVFAVGLGAFVFGLLGSFFSYGAFNKVKTQHEVYQNKERAIPKVVRVQALLSQSLNFISVLLIALTITGAIIIMPIIIEQRKGRGDN